MNETALNVLAATAKYLGIASREVDCARHVDNASRTSSQVAKRWLKALRANDPDARARFERAYPDGSVTPTLRDMRHALAREYGQESWVALKQALALPGVTLEGTRVFPAHVRGKYST